MMLYPGDQSTLKKIRLRVTPLILGFGVSLAPSDCRPMASDTDGDVQSLECLHSSTDCEWMMLSKTSHHGRTTIDWVNCPRLSKIIRVRTVIPPQKQYHVTSFRGRPQPIDDLEQRGNASSPTLSVPPRHVAPPGPVRGHGNIHKSPPCPVLDQVIRLPRDLGAASSSTRHASSWSIQAWALRSSRSLAPERCLCMLQELPGPRRPRRLEESTRKYQSDCA